MKGYIQVMLLVFAGLGLFLPSCKTQQGATAPEMSQVDYLVEGQFKILEVDKLGFCYLVNHKNEILKYDADFNLLFRYSVRSLGDITTLNVSNPQKIFVYYGDYNQIVLLENTLSEIKRLDLEGLGLYNISGATVGRDNFIWLLDNANLRLIKINENGKIFLSSNEQDPVLRAFVAETPDLHAYDNQIYLNNKEQIAVYDEFGVHQKNLPIASPQLQFENDQLFYITDQEIKRYDLKVDFLKESNISSVKNFQSEGSDFYITNNRLLLIDGYGLYQL